MCKGARVQSRCHYTMFTKCGTHGSTGFVILTLTHKLCNQVIRAHVAVIEKHNFSLRGDGTISNEGS